MNKYIDSFLELLYPEKNTCYICDKHDLDIKDSFICKSCLSKFHTIEGLTCVKCNKELSYETEDGLCKDCASGQHQFYKLMAPFHYDGLVKQCIYEYKYYNSPYYYKMFGNLLYDYMIKTGYTDFDFIISVPLHSIKRRMRGYNQSELIAKYLSEKLSIDYINALKRNSNTVKQSSLSRTERLKNLNNSFSIKNKTITTKLNNKKVLLIDDIFTTGATVDACCNALKCCNIQKIYVLTICR